MIRSRLSRQSNFFDNLSSIFRTHPRSSSLKPILIAKMSTVESAKQKAGETAVNDWLKDGQVVGIGSGSTITYAVKAIARRVQNEKLRIKCVPTSFQAKELILENDLELTSLDKHYQIDVAFDGADEVCRDFTIIKGGGGCLLQEKIVASCSRDFIVLIDESKCSETLGSHWTRGLPIEVIPMACKPVQSWIENSLGGKAVLRPAITKMGPQLTDNGNFILDWQFDPKLKHDWPKIGLEILKLPGVVETGLFINMARRIYIGHLDGSLKTWDNSHPTGI
ncbi:unnamed protein product [Calicophoron daubneyi]|uniref:ribose-5-phosphate isomerase n=1 Tax=Calicophoron daubneyi TaxID=300641 RepID=A0AAV2TN07_CALDB